MAEETIAPWFDQQVTPREKRLLALTIVFHPDPERIGTSFTHDAAGGTLDVSRLSPTFSAEGVRPRDIGVSGVSRKPLQIAPTQTGWRFTPPANPSYRIDGAAGPTERTDASLERGVLVELAGWVLLWVRTGAAIAERRGLGLVGCSRAMGALRTAIRQVAPSDVPVLILGPSGAGKELVARAIHEQSKRFAQPYFAINLAAVAGSSAVSQLFGHARGAFTGADRQHRGFFQRCDRGTLLIDEIGEVRDEVQPLLLRALESGEIQPLGGAPTQVDVRTIFSTDASLETMVADGRFRKALYYRMAQLIVHIPPLGDRPEDKAVQAVHFLREALERSQQSRLLDADRLWLAPSFMNKVLAYPWPGNSRELRAVMQRAVVRSAGADQIELDAGELDFDVRSPEPEPAGDAASGPPPKAPGLPRRDELVVALRANGFIIGRTAKALGIGRTGLYQMMETFQIPMGKDLDAAQIRAALDAAGGHLEQAADALCVSKRALVLRMRALGLER